MELNYECNFTYSVDEDHLCQLRFCERPYILDDKLFELFTKLYSKVVSTGGDFWRLFNNNPMSIF